MAVEKLIEEGRLLLQGLQQAGIKLRFAVWSTDPGDGSTYLSLGSDNFDADGLRLSYRTINATIDSLKNRFVLLNDDVIRVVPLDSSLGKTFLERFGSGARETSIGMFVSGQFILHQVYSYQV